MAATCEFAVDLELLAFGRLAVEDESADEVAPVDGAARAAVGVDSPATNAAE